ncbi:MAG: calcium/sodium antiporter [Planctomycetes bacterium]|nr:calcium/sodium antiporter [Planctomycetota bacterium]MCB9936022.1 calcium/sodium antiporter [Planctomycetota bacterium]
MDIAIIILQLVFGALGLHFGANWLVSGSSRLALSFGIKPLIIGLTLVAFGTSAPELTVSMAGALQGSADLSVGNVIGSNIANIGLVLGVASLIRPINVDPEVFRRDLPAMLFVTLLIAVLPFIGGPVAVGDGAGFVIERWKAAILLAAMAFILFLMFRGAKGGDEEGDAAAKHLRGALAGLTVLGLGALVLGGKLFVDGAVEAAQMLGVPELVIGLTVLAVGTSLPELATSIVAIIRGESAISLGNVVGSNMFNICVVLGLVSMVAPLAIDARVMKLDMIVMLAFSGGVTAMAWQGRRIGRPEGALLLGAYALYVTNLVVGWV